MNRPLIAVSGSRHRGRVQRICAYILLWVFGARPKAIFPVVDEYKPLERFDGFLLLGGSDITARYGGNPYHPTEVQKHRRSWPLRIFARMTAGTPDVERDRFETRIVRYAMEHDLPLLGICRGMQLVNVALGGTLINDLFANLGLRRVQSARVVRSIESITGTSKISRIVELGQGVNSLHHQAVDTLGRGLVVSSRDDQNVIQSIESPEARFLVCVQWHPELVPLHPSSRRLFHAFVAQCST